jgi:hypothetical protein
MMEDMEMEIKVRDEEIKRISELNIELETSIRIYQNKLSKSKTNDKDYKVTK